MVIVSAMHVSPCRNRDSIHEHGLMLRQPIEDGNYASEKYDFLWPDLELQPRGVYMTHEWTWCDDPVGIEPDVWLVSYVGRLMLDPYYEGDGDTFVALDSIPPNFVTLTH